MWALFWLAYAWRQALRHPFIVSRDWSALDTVPGPPMLFHTPGCHCFNRWVILLCVDTQHFVCLPLVYGQLYCVHILTMMNKAATNIHVEYSYGCLVCTRVHMHINSRAYNSMLKFERFFNCFCKVSGSAQTFVIPFVNTKAILVVVEWYFIVVSISISLLTNETDYFTPWTLRVCECVCVCVFVSQCLCVRFT